MKVRIFKWTDEGQEQRTAEDAINKWLGKERKIKKVFTHGCSKTVTMIFLYEENNEENNGDKRNKV